MAPTPSTYGLCASNCPCRPIKSGEKTVPRGVDFPAAMTLKVLPNKKMVKRRFAARGAGNARPREHHHDERLSSSDVVEAVTAPREGSILRECP
jgi:hypothetical protein